MDDDLQVRLAAFAWLSEQMNVMGDVLPSELEEQRPSREALDYCYQKFQMGRRP